MAYLSFRNKVKKRPEERAKLLDKYVVASQQSEDDSKLRAWIELGDRHPDFVYTLWLDHEAFQVKKLYTISTQA